MGELQNKLYPFTEKIVKRTNEKIRRKLTEGDVLDIFGADTKFGMAWQALKAGLKNQVRQDWNPYKASRNTRAPMRIELRSDQQIPYMSSSKAPEMASKAIRDSINDQVRENPQMLIEAAMGDFFSRPSERKIPVKGSTPEAQGMLSEDYREDILESEFQTIMDKYGD